MLDRYVNVYFGGLTNLGHVEPVCSVQKGPQADNLLLNPHHTDEQNQFSRV